MKDNFSNQAESYLKFRPSYPPQLFEFILKDLKRKTAAWDCATGNGQTALELAKSFSMVFATDISQQQLDNAYNSDKIYYSLQPAEETIFASNAFDLITVSQALHWFQFDKFYKEVKRVAKPNARIAVWMYALLRINPEIDQIIDQYHFKTLEKYWDDERKFVDQHYRTIPFPFKEIECPPFQIENEWTLKELKGYLNTWSAVQKFVDVNGYSPVDDLIKKIKPLWENEKMKIIFPVYMRMGQIDK